MLASGTGLGIVVGQPMVAVQLAYFLLMILLAVFLIDPWLPILESWPVMNREEDETGAASESGCPKLSARIRTWERLGWIALGAIGLSVAVLHRDGFEWDRAYSEDQITVLMTYLFLLFFLLIMTVVAFWVRSFFLSFCSQTNRVQTDLLYSSLVRFQIRGWVIIFAILMFSPLFV